MSTTRERIDELVQAHPVVVFMKGNRRAPKCGFSATVVDILDDYLDDYFTVDVLQDPAVRDGIKEYSDWPTIPQLYVGGQFVGGSDIVREMRESGELDTLLGRAPEEVAVPQITVTPGAVAALQAAWDGDGPPVVRLAIDRSFQNELWFDLPKEGDVIVKLGRCSVVMDRSTARRAPGLSIGWHDRPEGGGFKIDNPAAPPSVRELAPGELKEWLAQGKPMEVFDVRTAEERSTARIEGTVLLDEAGKERLESLDRDTVLVLHCHHGVRSRAAAEHCLRMGFRTVYNVTGGIEAWSRDVDPSVPRY
jgi:monothiol glutaredoxin